MLTYELNLNILNCSVLPYYAWKPQFDEMAAVYCFRCSNK